MYIAMYVEHMWLLDLLKIYISYAAGIGFNTSSYYITMDSDYVINVTVLVTLSDFLTSDDNFILETKSFYYITDSRFSVDPDSGEIKIIRKLDPLRLHYARVYLKYNGTINTTKSPYSSSASILIRIFTLGKCYYEYHICKKFQTGKVS